MKNLRNFSLILILLTVTNCANNRSYTGSTLGAITTTATCLQFTNNPIVSATCAVTGAMIGAELMYNSDFDVHNAVFVDHLNKGTSNSYTNWHNDKTGNWGSIKTYSTYTEGPIKCKDYESTIDITSTWPMIGIGAVNRKVEFGTACQMPDGRWAEKTQLTQSMK